MASAPVAGQPSDLPASGSAMQALPLGNGLKWISLQSLRKTTTSPGFNSPLSCSYFLMSAVEISGDADHLLLSVVASNGRTSMTRARPQVCSMGTFSVVTVLVPRGPYFFSYSTIQPR